MGNYFLLLNAGLFTILMDDVTLIIGLLAMNAMKPGMNGVREPFPITVKTVAQPLSIVSITLKKNSIEEGSLSRLMAYPPMRPAV